MFSVGLIALGFQPFEIFHVAMGILEKYKDNTFAPRGSSYSQGDHFSRFYELKTLWAKLANVAVIVFA